MAVLTDEIRAAIHSQLTAAPSKAAERAQARDYKFMPYASEALGVSPEQVTEAKANLRAHGCMVDFDRDGRALITSEKQVKEVAKAAGLWSGRDGFAVRDGEGRQVHTGRELQRRRAEFRRAVLSGEISF